MESNEFESTNEPEEGLGEAAGDQEEPPSNAEDWNDEQWLTWLRRTDEAVEQDDHPAPVTTSARVAHSLGGQIVGQAMLGLSNAIYGKTDDDVVIVIPADSNPEEDELITVNLHPDDPRQSTVIVRDGSAREKSNS